MKPTLEQVLAFAASEIEEVTPPNPYEIALTLGAALLSSGRYGDDGGAAIASAWTLVIPFYQGKAAYEAHGAMLFNMSQHASAPEPDMTAGEARAYVTGGESGHFGEHGLGAPELARATVRTAPATQTIDLDPAAARQADHARQVHIAECAQRVQAARLALDVALANKRKPAIAKAQKEWDAATAEQSAAYL